MKKEWLLILSITLILSCAKEEGNPIVTPPGQSYRTQYASMQLVGDFQGWNLNDFEHTKMTLVSDWQWERTVYFSAPQDSIRFKFVANRDWNVSFGTEAPDTGLSGYAELLQGGFGNHITAGPLTKAGYWKFEFNEKTLFYKISFVEAPQGKISGRIYFADDSIPPYPEATVTYFIEGDSVALGSVNSDTLTGDYIIENLDDGVYKLIFSAFGYTQDTVTGISISGGNSVTGVDVTLEPVTVVYATPDPPFITVQVDGDTADWTQPAIRDSIGDSDWGSGGDIGNLYVGHDSENLYIACNYSASNNAFIIFIHAGTPDTLDGTRNANTLDWFPRNFQFKSGEEAEFIVANWVGDGFPPALRHILDSTTTEEIDTSYYEFVNTVPENGGEGIIEIKIPYTVLYGMGSGVVPPYASVKVVALIAGGDHWNGPESVPENPGMDGSGNPTLIEIWYEEIIDTDGQ